MAGKAKAAPQPVPDDARRVVLSKAVVRAAGLLGVTQTQVAETIGVSDATASRMFGGKYLLDPNCKEWELASLFVRLFRSLESIVGSDDKARQWLRSRNLALGERPLNLIPKAEGLIRVLHYLDAARGRI
ncbi:MAG: MbcA/ParS/Xre antitoxin family protein [Burkholderiales bacterium]